jgi:hypothetical protein
MIKIEIKREVHVALETAEIKLPYYFKTIARVQSKHCWAVLEDLSIVQSYRGENYVAMSVSKHDSVEEVASFMEGYYRNYEVEEVTEEYYKEVVKEVQQIITSKL